MTEKVEIIELTGFCNKLSPASPVSGQHRRGPAAPACQDARIFSTGLVRSVEVSANGLGKDQGEVGVHFKNQTAVACVIFCRKHSVFRGRSLHGTGFSRNFARLLPKYACRYRDICRTSHWTPRFEASGSSFSSSEFGNVHFRVALSF